VKATSTPERSSPRGRSPNNERMASSDPMLLSFWPHQSSLAERHISIGTCEALKAKHAVCTARRNGDTKTTSTPSLRTRCFHDTACLRPRSVRRGSNMSSPRLLTLASLWPWRRSSNRFGLAPFGLRSRLRHASLRLQGTAPAPGQGEGAGASSVGAAGSWKRAAAQAGPFCATKW